MLLLLDIVFIAPRQKTVLLAFFTERRDIAAKFKCRLADSHQPFENDAMFGCNVFPTLRSIVAEIF